MAGYRRTISFPAPRAAATANAKLAAAYRVRSASLPCRFHPLILQLDDDVAALRLVLTGGCHSPSSSATTAPPSASTVSAAAAQVVRVLASLSDLLHHPQAQEPLRRLATSSSSPSPLADRLLDDFLRLADAHGSFRESLVSLAALQAETRAAIRRGDPARHASAARAQRRAAGRDLPRLAAAARAVASKPLTALPDDLSPETAALVAAVADSTVAVASASAAVFSGVSALSNAAAAARVDVASTPCWIMTPSRFAATRTSHQRVWWVADLVRWMSRAKRRSAGKQSRRANDDDDDASTSSTAQLRPEARVMKPEERARKAALELHDNLERCIASVDCSGEKVFRGLVNTRVSLLNILSPTF